MNLGNMECVSAYRTPTRLGMSRPGVVIAEMRCLRDKRSVLERKRFIRHLQQYQHVFIKASKSHTEQVIEANFNIILREMKNSDEYYVNDNGRIMRKIRDSNDHFDIVCYTDQAQGYNSNREHYGSLLHCDGAKPKQHSIIARVCHMAIGTLITLQHVIVLLHQAIPDMKAPTGDQTYTHRATMFPRIQILAIMINTCADG